MRISSRGEYGVRAMFDLAMHYGAGPIPLKLIAERQDISEHYLEQLMGTLRKAGLVKSVRGAQGGYRLAAEPKKITLGEIIRVLEGPVLPVDELQGSGAKGDDLERNAVFAFWKDLEGNINAAMDGWSLEDLRHKAEQLQVESGSYIYHI